MRWSEKKLLCNAYVDQIRNYLFSITPNAKDFFKERHNVLLSNISYQIQYLDYLKYRTNTEEYLMFTSSIQNQIRKTYVINATSAFEGILTLIAGDWSLLSSKDEKISLFECIRRVKESSNYFTSFQREFCDELNILRNERNKVHPSKASMSSDSDYNSFWNESIKQTDKMISHWIDSPISKGPDRELIFKFIEEHT